MIFSYKIASESAGFWNICLCLHHSIPSNHTSFQTAWTASISAEWWDEVVVSCGHSGVLQRPNCTLLLLNFSGWRDARRENSRKTSTQETWPVEWDTWHKSRGLARLWALWRQQGFVCWVLLYFSNKSNLINDIKEMSQKIQISSHPHIIIFRRQEK